MAFASRAACLAAAGLGHGAARQHGARQRQGHRAQDGGAGLAADPHHEGSGQREVQGAVRQQRQARGRLHPLAGLLRARSPPRSPRARRSTRWPSRTASGSAPSSRAATTCRSTSSSRPTRSWQKVFKDLHPAVVWAYSTYPYKSDKLLRLPADAGRADHLLPQGRLLRRRRAEGLPGQVRQEAALHRRGDGQRRLGSGQDLRRVLPAQEGREAGRQAADDDFYGIEYQAGKDYDFSIMQVNGFIWQHGGNIWDETKAPKGQAEGVVNSPEAVKALDHYLSLLQYMPPVAKTGDHGHLQDRRAVPRRQGRLRDRVDRLRREHRSTRRPRRSPTRSPSPSRRACAAPTAS